MAKKKDEETNVEETTTDVQKTSNGIEIGEPMDLTPKSLPLVIKLSDKASTAQIEYAKIVNGYAYSNPKKFKEKKDEFVAKLESLGEKEVTVFGEDGPERPNKHLEMAKAGMKNGQMGGTKFQFNFIRTPDGFTSTLPDNN